MKWNIGIEALSLRYSSLVYHHQHQNTSQTYTHALTTCVLSMTHSSRCYYATRLGLAYLREWERESEIERQIQIERKAIDTDHVVFWIKTKMTTYDRFRYGYCYSCRDSNGVYLALVAGNISQQPRWPESSDTVHMPPRYTPPPLLTRARMHRGFYRDERWWTGPDFVHGVQT